MVAISRRLNRNRFTFIVLLLASATILTLDFRGAPILDDVRGAAASIFAPVRSSAEQIFEPVSNTWNGIVNYSGLKAKNERLRDRLEAIQGERIRAEEAQQRLRELERQLELPIVPRIEKRAARVVSGPISSFEHASRIDRGSNEGIRVGMPVVTGAGLAGRIVQVTRDQSVVELITVPDTAIGIRLARSGEIGVAHGTGPSSPLLVEDGINPDAAIERNEAVTTSGLVRSVFPPNLPVGRVVRASLSSSRLTQVVRIEPLADLKNLGYVNVLLWTPDE